MSTTTVPLVDLAALGNPNLNARRNLFGVMRAIEVACELLPDHFITGQMYSQEQSSYCWWGWVGERLGLDVAGRYAGRYDGLEYETLLQELKALMPSNCTVLTADRIIGRGGSPREISDAMISRFRLELRGQLNA